MRITVSIHTVLAFNRQNQCVVWTSCWGFSSSSLLLHVFLSPAGSGFTLYRTNTVSVCVSRVELLHLASSSLHLVKPKEYDVPASPAPPPPRPPPPPPPLLPPPMKVKQTLDTHRKHGAMRRLSITRGHPDWLCCSGTLRYDKRYLNDPLRVSWVQPVTAGGCLLGSCRETEPERPVCTLHIIFKPKHIIACLERRACEQKTARPGTLICTEGTTSLIDIRLITTILFDWWNKLLNLYFLKYHTVYVLYGEGSVNYFVDF